MVLLQAVSIVIASAGVFAAAMYYIFQLRHQSKMRQMDFIMRVPSSFIRREVFEALATVMKTEFKSFDDFEGKCGIEASQMSAFCEDLGLLVKRKVIDISLVAERYNVNAVYEKLKPWIEATRKRDNNPKLYEWFEYLANEEKEYYQQLASKTA